MTRTLVHIFSFLILPNFLNAQDTAFTLTGNVTDCSTHSKLEGITLKLICSDGRSLETVTNKSGTYFFDNTILKKDRVYILRTQNQMGWEYFNSSENYKFGTFDSISTRSMRKDFCLSKNEGCTLRSPVLYFEKNSVMNYTFENDAFDLEFLKELMFDNPTLVFEIAANNSIDEKNPLELSQKRAEYLQNLLVQKGIPKERLVIKIYGTEKPIIPAEEIKKLKTKDEKEEANKKNRRIAFNIMRKDFIPVKTN